MIKLSIYAVTIFQSEIQEWHRSGNGFESNRPETQYLPFKVLIYRPAEDAPSAAFAFPLLLLSIAEPGDNIEGLRRSIRWWWAGELDEEA